MCMATVAQGLGQQQQQYRVDRGKSGSWPEPGARGWSSTDPRSYGRQRSYPRWRFPPAQFGSGCRPGRDVSNQLMALEVCAPDSTSITL